jgi:hypothetical protein
MAHDRAMEDKHGHHLSTILAELMKSFTSLIKARMRIVLITDSIASIWSLQGA